jgi:hypothetical protein
VAFVVVVAVQWDMMRSASHRPLRAASPLGPILRPLTGGASGAGVLLEDDPQSGLAAAGETASE